jgi:phytoene synthase
LLDGRAEAVSALATEGLTRLARARAARSTVPKTAGYALFTGWQAEAMLRQAAADPAAVADSRLSAGAVRSSWRLARMALSGRW